MEIFKSLRGPGIWGIFTKALPEGKEVSFTLDLEGRPECPAKLTGAIVIDSHRKTWRLLGQIKIPGRGWKDIEDSSYWPSNGTGVFYVSEEAKPPHEYPLELEARFVGWGGN